MAALSSLLPAPSQHGYDREEEDIAQRMQQQATALVAVTSPTAPPYGHRKGWIPRTAEDFGDGGAFPEVHVAQYPMGLGQKKTTSNALAKQVDASGKVKYDAIAKYGHGKDKVVHSKFSDLVPKTLEDGNPALERPDEDEIKEITESTKAALEKLTRSKITAAMPVRAADKQAPAQYIRYTPSQQGVAFNSGAKQRIIRMVEAQKDPMSPPRFKTNKKIPRGPPSPPAPVMHSPNRKVSVKEQQEWKIPPCISNWKNAKGYTIPLDKRLAADGRGLQSVHINENFAKLAESLYVADRKAREAVEMRAQMERKIAQREKEKHEEKLRQLAQKARDRGWASGARMMSPRREMTSAGIARARGKGIGIWRGQLLTRDLASRGSETGTSARRLRWECPTREEGEGETTSNLTSASSIRAGAWTVVSMRVRMSPTTSMTNPGATTAIWPPPFTGRLRILTVTSMAMTWTN
ncbi:hypothetical protein CAPTEDRAFT_153812 [Capitella teleta]|uniref:SKI-interacting protein SKIP SNW domain-containing protein n=1 Tax=Capitella teleta TaxID=283909 RepID=R7TY88_CAPTE|nr:hypothetical protein CAPTEDRAFT_153812 [Capitella teleta]|eukprot:ELT98858.1 hypothetical protein CAPTEDRAFT_153812 [Capitella teleta]